MPRLEDRTVGDQIHEFLAPEQPEDCRKANLEILAKALAITGPVVHLGHVVTAKTEGDEHTIDFDASRPTTPNPPTTIADEDGTVHAVDPRELTDADIAIQWGLPAASTIPLPQPEQSEV